MPGTASSYYIGDPGTVAGSTSGSGYTSYYQPGQDQSASGYTGSVPNLSQSVASPLLSLPASATAPPTAIASTATTSGFNFNNFLGGILGTAANDAQELLVTAPLQAQQAQTAANAAAAQAANQAQDQADLASSEISSVGFYVIVAIAVYFIAQKL
jgi:hypothetical protein